MLCRAIALLMIPYRPITMHITYKTMTHHVSGNDLYFSLYWLEGWGSVIF